MPNPELNRKTKTKVENSSSLKGTLTSVLLLGGFLIVSWIGVFLLFINRF
ncbi:cytochrome c oxidase subunit 2A [Lysinibacillus sphaericus]